MTNKEFVNIIKNTFEKYGEKIGSGYNANIRISRNIRYKPVKNDKYYAVINVWSGEKKYKKIMKSVLNELKEKYAVSGKIKDNVIPYLNEKPGFLYELDIFIYTTDCDIVKRRDELKEKAQKEEIKRRCEEYKTKKELTGYQLNYLMDNDDKIKKYVYLNRETKNHIKELVVYKKFLNAFFKDECYSKHYYLLKEIPTSEYEIKNLIRIFIAKKEEKELIELKEKEKNMKEVKKEIRRKENLRKKIEQKKQEIEMLEQLIKEATVSENN